MPTAGKAEWTSAALSIVATVFIGLRIFSRFGLLKRSYIDDYLIVIALLLSWTLTALIFAQAWYGLGRHFNEISAQDFNKMNKHVWVSIPFYNLSLTITKLSVLFQFLRFFVTKLTRRLTWSLIIIVAVYGTVIFIVSMYPCRPLAYYWDKSITGGRCIDLLAFWYANASFNIITDFAVVGLPIHVLKDIQLPKRQKWALVVIFAFGGFTCITSILRLKSIYVVANSDDVTWNNVDAVMWSAIELNTAIVCSCMPALKPLVLAVAPRWLTLSDVSSRNTTRVERVSRGTIRGPIKKTTDIHISTMSMPEVGSTEAIISKDCAMAV